MSSLFSGKIKSIIIVEVISQKIPTSFIQYQFNFYHYFLFNILSSFVKTANKEEEFILHNRQEANNYTKKEIKRGLKDWVFRIIVLEAAQDIFQ